MEDIKHNPNEDLLWSSEEQRLWRVAASEIFHQLQRVIRIVLVYQLLLALYTQPPFWWSMPFIRFRKGASIGTYSSNEGNVLTFLSLPDSLLHHKGQAVYKTDAWRGQQGQKMWDMVKSGQRDLQVLFLRSTHRSFSSQFHSCFNIAHWSPESRPRRDLPSNLILQNAMWTI